MATTMITNLLYQLPEKEKKNKVYNQLLKLRKISGTSKRNRSPPGGIPFVSMAHIYHYWVAWTLIAVRGFSLDFLAKF